MQSDGNSFCRDFVFDGVNMAHIGMKSAFYAKYIKSKYLFLLFI